MRTLERIFVKATRLPISQLLTSVFVGVFIGVLTFVTLASVWPEAKGRYAAVMLGLQRHSNIEVNGKDVNNSRNWPVTQQLQEPQQQKQVRVLVWVLTEPNNHVKKAVHVRDTWGKRVDKLLFMSTADDLSLPTVNLHVQEGREFLWGKTRAAFKYVYENHLQDADWFMKADDDTFVVVENLRYMLSLYNPDTPIYFGCRFKPFHKKGYMSGGAGYVLSKAALKLFVEKALYNTTLCRRDPGGNEDVEMGKCLNNVDVMAGDSRDDLGRYRFFSIKPVQVLVPSVLETVTWYFDYIYYPMKAGSECCSDTAISFHYITPEKMMELDFLIYQLRPHGLHRHDPDTPKLPPDLKSVPKEVLDKT